MGMHTHSSFPTSMKPTMRHFEMALHTLMPVHIGTGVELMKDIDFITGNGMTARLDVDGILMDLWNPEHGNVLPSQLLQGLTPEARRAYYLYIARGTIRAARESSKLRECIKTPEQQPYIPGSSLKGALRTALAWSAWPQQIRRPLRPDDIGRSKSWAGQRLEDGIFRPAKDRGDGPNKDLLRALHVGDLHLVNAGEGLQVLNVSVARTRDFASPIEVEAVSTNAVFKGRLSIDEYVFGEQARGLGLHGQRAWLDELTKRVNQHSVALLDSLITRFKTMQQEGASHIAQGLAVLRDTVADLPDGRCVLCLGWGGGWDSKTFGTRLQADPRFFEEQIINNLGLLRRGVVRKAGDPFPRTRRVIVRERQDRTRVASVLGWCQLDLRPEGRIG